MARPSADGVDASHAGPARGDDASEAGPSAGNLVPRGEVDPSATSSSTAIAAAAADHPHVNLLPEQDHFMLVANVIRIMCRVLPMHAKISDGAKEMMQECASEYINLITGEANEATQDHYRRSPKTCSGRWKGLASTTTSAIAPVHSALLPSGGRPTHRPPR